MAPACCVNIAHNWKLPKLMIFLFILELPLTIACLVFFGVADPDTYRTKMWQNGSDKGFNSNPNEILYSYANYRPIKIPLVWSSFLTEFNVVISVLSMFILLTKSVMFVLHAFVPILSLVVHALLIALYAVAVRNQSTPDLSDTKVPDLSRNMPWYLEKGCKYATKGNHGYCMQARASFGVTCVMLALFVVYLALAIWSSIITPEEKASRRAEYEEDIELKATNHYDPDYGLSQEQKWERNRQIFLNLPKTPNTPHGRYDAMTPRTTAFAHLSGGESSTGTVGRNTMANMHLSAGSGSGSDGWEASSRPLAFREQYGETRQPDGR